jgi:hypothetical protein
VKPVQNKRKLQFDCLLKIIPIFYQNILKLIKFSGHFELLIDKIFLDSYGGFRVFLSDVPESADTVPCEYPTYIKSLNFVPGRRHGYLKLIIAGYWFVKSNGNYKTTYWRCSRALSANCKSRLVLHRDDNRIQITSPYHNHGPEENEN